MNRSVLFKIILIILLVSHELGAGECRVGSHTGGPGKGGFHHWLKAAIEKGECRTSDPGIMTQYATLAKQAPSYQVIRFTQSMSIELTEPLPTLAGLAQEPLLILADDAATVEIVGHGYSIDIGGEGRVIIDHLTFLDFDQPALRFKSDHNVLIRSTVMRSGSATTPAVAVTGRYNQILDSTIKKNRATGISISDAASVCAADRSVMNGYGTLLSGNRIAQNGTLQSALYAAYGVYVSAFGVELSKNVLEENFTGGAYIRTESSCGNGEWPGAGLHTVLMQQNGFAHNGNGDSVVVSAFPLPAPIDLVNVEPESDDFFRITGRIPVAADAESPWSKEELNMAAAHVELYLAVGSPAEGRFFVGSSPVDSQTRQFILAIPKSVPAQFNSVGNPVFTATLVDDEHRNTSPFAKPLLIQNANDTDGDGLPNSVEDYNGNGEVDMSFGETDPTLTDTDGDGLTDGEERNLDGRVAAWLKDGSLILAEPAKLNPTRSDSDADCLPDGLEMGLSLSEIPQTSPGQESMRYPFSAACQAIRKAHGLLVYDNAILADPSQPFSFENIRTFYDRAIGAGMEMTRTDPTNRDTDHDDVTDGEEDWNMDGMQNKDERGNLLETDPANRDSDGDGLADGDEGDRNGSGGLDPRETDPLRMDTDDDGVHDDVEAGTFGLMANACDSDQDDLPDGVEMGVVHPNPSRPECAGLQTVGTNFKIISVLDAAAQDSDKDKLADGDEDLNHNGYLEPGETDPTTIDTDHDGLSDYLEVTGDLDEDGIGDIELTGISNGSACSPPSFLIDLDCDGEINALDIDSDNDGCLDAEEMEATVKTGVPAPYTAGVKGCGESAALPTPPADLPEPAEAVPPSWPVKVEVSPVNSGGGACSLTTTYRFRKNQPRGR